MSAASITPVSVLHLFQAESGMRTQRPNVLIEGHSAATEAMLLLIRPHVRGLVSTHLLYEPLDLPYRPTNGLILREVAALTAEEQAWLLDWLDDAGSRAQVVSTTERSLSGLVEHGFFSAALYDRLKIVRLSIGRPAAYPVVERAPLGHCRSHP